MATEKELDLALAAELEKSPDFLSWFVSNTKFAGSVVTFHSCRAIILGERTRFATPTKPVRKLLCSPVRDRHSLATQGQERPHCRRSCRNKVGAGKFTNDQVECIPARCSLGGKQAVWRLRGFRYCAHCSEMFENETPSRPHNSGVYFPRAYRAAHSAFRCVSGAA